MNRPSRALLPKVACARWHRGLVRPRPCSLQATIACAYRRGYRVCVSIGVWLRPRPGYYLGAGYTYYLDLGCTAATACLSRQGCAAATISVCTGRSYSLVGMRGWAAALTIYLSIYLGMRGPQLLSRYARAAATAISAMRLSQRGLRRGYYLGVGCAAATISLGLRGPQLLSRHERGVSERIGYYLGWLSLGYYVSAVAYWTWQGRRRRRCGNTFVCGHRRHSTAQRGAAEGHQVSSSAQLHRLPSDGLQQISMRGSWSPKTVVDGIGRPVPRARSAGSAPAGHVPTSLLGRLRSDGMGAARKC